jgi:Na+-translocating ferredoxin:NAD+ oxidoreductase RnfG subunit
MGRRIKQIFFFALCVLLLTGGEYGEAKVYLSKKEALKLAFPDAETIETEKISLSREERARILERAGTRLRLSRMEVHLAMANGSVLGYAIIHDVKGKSRPITYMAVITPQGAVERVEVLAYRESHGGEIRYPSFLKQFVAKTLADPIRHKRDIRNISGATISCRAISDGVRTLLALWEEIYGREVGP